MSMARVCGTAGVAARRAVHARALARRPESPFAPGRRDNQWRRAGAGWYAGDLVPGLFKSTEPAWKDENLGELARDIRSPLFFTHIRAAIGSPVQRTNCHPFRHERWLFMDNGFIADFDTIKRDLVLAIDESLCPQIKGEVTRP